MKKTEASCIRVDKPDVGEGVTCSPCNNTTTKCSSVQRNRPNDSEGSFFIAIFLSEA